MNKVFYENWGHVHVARRKGLSFAPHMHDQMEILFLRTGNITVYIDSEAYTLTPDCCCVIFPNQLHSYVDNENIENDLNYIAIFKSELLKSFGKDFDQKVPKNPIITDKNKLDKIQKYFEEALSQRASNSAYWSEASNACAVLMLTQALDSFEYKSAKLLKNDAAADIFAYCNKNFDQDISLDKMSKELNISKDHIMRLFRERFHTNFRNYINQLRIEKAKKLLNSSDMTVTDISINVGYNTIRSFNRAFLEITGYSPSQYRQRKKLIK